MSRADGEGLIIGLERTRSQLEQTDAIDPIEPIPTPIANGRYGA
jgi:hypothetical protein